MYARSSFKLNQSTSEAITPEMTTASVKPAACLLTAAPLPDVLPPVVPFVLLVLLLGLEPPLETAELHVVAQVW